MSTDYDIAKPTGGLWARAMSGRADKRRVTTACLFWANRDQSAVQQRRGLFGYLLVVAISSKRSFCAMPNCCADQRIGG